MKKLALVFLITGVFFTLSACSSTEENEVETKVSSATVKESTTEDASRQLNNQMKEMQSRLEDQGIEFGMIKNEGFLLLEREKSIDYDYFSMSVYMTNEAREVYEISLVLKGNIDGKLKDPLYYNVNAGRIVESSTFDTDINAIAEVLDSFDCSDKEFVQFLLWYYDNN